MLFLSNKAVCSKNKKERALLQIMHYPHQLHEMLWFAYELGL